MNGPNEAPAAPGGRRLHHVGVVVTDLAAASGRYHALGFTPGAPPIALLEQNVLAVTFSAGDGWVELIQPTDPDGPIARYLTKRGEGFHHVAYQVEDLDGALAELAKAGVRLIDSVGRSGVHGWRIAFIHPESCAGVLTELVEVPDE